jgi:hypothetical protein
MMPMASKPQMAEAHSQAFRDAAKRYKVYILVRRTNLKSLLLIRDPDCVAKRLDCKAKTAQNDYQHPKFGLKSVAGLVVDPTITGQAAFQGPNKYIAAIQEWGKFATVMLDPAILTMEGQRRLTYIPNGKFYFVDLDPASPRYSCVRFSSNSLMTAGKYIYGDFDLYGIVRADDPARNVAVSETRLNQPHSRSPEFFDVQHFVNRRIGVPMVLHGAQESYSDEHSDEGIDVFTPDGGFMGKESRADLIRLYETKFKGRRLFTKNGPREIVLGMFTVPG